MKRTRVALLLAIAFAPIAFADTIVSIGGGASYDDTIAVQLQPLIDVALLGAYSWLPTDRIGLFADVSAGGTYEPLSGVVAGLFAVTADASYMSDGYLMRMSASSVASPSTAEVFYSASTADLLLSYGSPAGSVSIAPRFSLVEESGLTAALSGRFGLAWLFFESLLVKPSIEGGVDVPGGASTAWHLSPTLDFDWYPGGSVTLSVHTGYARSFSTSYSALVTGGVLLPLDSWERYSLSAEVSFLLGSGVSLTTKVPCDYYLKSYDAFSGSVDLGVSAWVVNLSPAIELGVPMSKWTDFVLSLEGNFDLSNSDIERKVSAAVKAHFEFHLE